MAGVFGMDILGIGAYYDYLPYVTNRNELRVFRVSDPNLLTPASEGFQRLNSFSSYGIHLIFYVFH